MEREGIISIATTNEGLFRKMFDCEIDRYNNIIIRFNPFWQGYQDQDKEYVITCEEVKEAVFRDYKEDYREQEICNFPDDVIENYAILLIKHIQQIETTVIETTTPLSARPEWKNDLCGHLINEL